jgi:hypothetical protein
MVRFWRLMIVLQWLALAAIIGISGYAIAIGGTQSLRNIFHSALPLLLILLALQTFRSRQFLRREQYAGQQPERPPKTDFGRYSSAAAAVIVLLFTGILLFSYLRR